VAQAAGLSLDSSATYQQQAAQVIASEILAKAPASSTGKPPADQATEASTMLQAYAASQFLSTTGQPANPATLVVVVTPQTPPSDGSADQLDQVLVPLVTELAAKSSATVVAGSSAGTGAGSPIAVLRSNNISSQVSTVDDADLVAGQTVAMQALAVAWRAERPAAMASPPTAPAPSRRARRPPRPLSASANPSSSSSSSLILDEKEGQEMRRAVSAAAAGACAAGAARLAYSVMNRCPPGGPKTWSTDQPPGRATSNLLERVPPVAAADGRRSGRGTGTREWRGARPDLTGSRPPGAASAAMVNLGEGRGGGVRCL